MPTNKITGENFTGDVYISDYLAHAAPSQLVCATVTCTPGARTSWKVNPLGQTLIVLSGIGWAQSEGEDVVEIRAGDIIRCAPGQRHWEGATPTHAITYMVVQEALNGTAIETKERVTDEEYFSAKKEKVTMRLANAPGELPPAPGKRVRGTHQDHKRV